MTYQLTLRFIRVAAALSWRLSPLGQRSDASPFELKNITAERAGISISVEPLKATVLPVNVSRAVPRIESPHVSCYFNGFAYFAMLEIEAAPMTALRSSSVKRKPAPMKATGRGVRPMLSAPPVT